MNGGTYLEPITDAARKRINSGIKVMLEAEGITGAMFMLVFVALEAGHGDAFGFGDPGAIMDMMESARAAMRDGLTKVPDDARAHDA